MIDLHCHILPALDDGAVDLADSVAMAAQAVADRITAVCATPHIRADHEVRISQLPARRAELQRELARRRVDVQILPGGEVAETMAAALSDSELRALSLGGGGWLLLEPAPGPLDDGLVALVDALAGRGLQSIIAHPERHAAADLVERLRELAAHGALIQWTAEFVAHARDGDLVLDCAAAGLVHLLGSDAHSSHAGRPVRLATAVTRLRTVCTPTQIAWIAEDAPTAILGGSPRVTPPW